MESRDRQIIAAYRNGRGAYRIARALGVSKHAVYAALRDSGVETRTPSAAAACRRRHLEGATFGDLTVQGRVAGSSPTVWRCRCACGAHVDVFQTNLVAGRSRSCGCARVRQHEEHDAMDKYGTHTPEGHREPGQKIASPVYCSICGRQAIAEGNVLRCPDHGTAPFETPPGGRVAGGRARNPADHK